jgi:hypothetical protein
LSVEQQSAIAQWRADYVAECRLSPEQSRVYDYTALPDGRSVQIIGARRISPGKGYVPIDPTTFRHDVFVAYQVYADGTRAASRFIGWCKQTEVAANAAKGGQIYVPVLRLHGWESLWIGDPRVPVERTVERQVGFDGSVIVYEWGWRRRSVRVSRNGHVLDLLYEANGTAHGYFSGREYPSLSQGIRALVATVTTEQPELIEQGRREWDQSTTTSSGWKRSTRRAR